MCTLHRGVAAFGAEVAIRCRQDLLPKVPTLIHKSVEATQLWTPEVKWIIELFEWTTALRERIFASFLRKKGRSYNCLRSVVFEGYFSWKCCHSCRPATCGTRGVMLNHQANAETTWEAFVWWSNRMCCSISYNRFRTRYYKTAGWKIVLYLSTLLRQTSCHNVSFGVAFGVILKILQIRQMFISLLTKNRPKIMFVSCAGEPHKLWFFWSIEYWEWDLFSAFGLWYDLFLESMDGFVTLWVKYCEDYSVHADLRQFSLWTISKGHQIQF